MSYTLPIRPADQHVLKDSWAVCLRQQYPNNTMRNTVSIRNNTLTPLLKTNIILRISRSRSLGKSSNTIGIPIQHYFRNTKKSPIRHRQELDEEVSTGSCRSKSIVHFAEFTGERQKSVDSGGKWPYLPNKVQ